jgi:hypothetical protein
MIQRAMSLMNSSPVLMEAEGETLRFGRRKNWYLEG